MAKESKTTPLIIEPHPSNYDGFPFITLIQYRNLSMLTVIDNVINNNIKAFVLDWCKSEGIDEELIFETIMNWYNMDKDKFPVSIAFARNGLTSNTSRIYRSFNMDFVTRVIGPLHTFPVRTVKSTKRKRRRSLSPTLLVNQTIDF